MSKAISPFHSQVHTCKHEEKHSDCEFMKVIGKISALALGVFAAYTSLKLFVPFFFVGIAIGIYGYTQNVQSCNHHSQAAGCGHSAIEELTESKLPPFVSLMALIAVTMCHIDHHAFVFVPIVAVSVGNWIGRTVCYCAASSPKRA